MKKTAHPIINHINKNKFSIREIGERIKYIKLCLSDKTVSDTHIIVIKVTIPFIINHSLRDIKELIHLSCFLYKKPNDISIIGIMAKSAITLKKLNILQKYIKYIKYCNNILPMFCKYLQNILK